MGLLVVVYICLEVASAVKGCRVFWVSLAPWRMRVLGVGLGCRALGV